MRKIQKTQIKIEKKVKPKIQPISNPNAIEVYFRDGKTIQETLAALASLNSNLGWQIITSYLNETKNQLLNQLRTLKSPNAIELSQKFTETQSQLDYIDYLLTLPKFLIDSYQEEIEKNNLDPYSF